VTLAEYKEAVEVGINKLFQAEKKTTPTAESKLLLNRMLMLIKRGGKRARPELLYMTYVAYGGRNAANLVDLGLALELHHQFLLVHDDIIDKDTIRYNGPNIVGYYSRDNKSVNAEATGLLAGDLLFSFSNQFIINSRHFDDEQKITLLRLLNQANIDVVYGQQLDSFNLDFESPDFIENLVLTHSLKSSSYSTQLPMDCAATLLSLPAFERQKITAFARPFGVLFQLVDDYSDYFNNDSVFNNRPKYRDFRQGKITYPLYIAMKTANKQQMEYIKQSLGVKNSSQEVMGKIVAILDDGGAKEATRNHIEQFFSQTFNALDKLSINSKDRQQFIKLLEKYRV
jgi:geranylgeranyl pyrophosphate synthase